MGPRETRSAERGAEPRRSSVRGARSQAQRPRPPRPPSAPRPLRDLDLAVEAQCVHDLLEQIARTSTGSRSSSTPPRILAHRRLPERFFLLRGGGGVPRPAGCVPPAGAAAGVGSLSSRRVGQGLSERLRRFPVRCPIQFAAGFGGGGIRLLIADCCPSVQRLVVIQYTSRPGRVAVEDRHEHHREQEHEAPLIRVRRGGGDQRRAPAGNRHRGG